MVLGSFGKNYFFTRENAKTLIDPMVHVMHGVADMMNTAAITMHGVYAFCEHTFLIWKWTFSDPPTH